MTDKFTNKDIYKLFVIILGVMIIASAGLHFGVKYYLDRFETKLDTAIELRESKQAQIDELKLDMKCIKSYCGIESINDSVITMETKFWDVNSISKAPNYWYVPLPPDEVMFYDRNGDRYFYMSKKDSVLMWTDMQQAINEGRKIMWCKDGGFGATNIYNKP